MRITKAFVMKLHNWTNMIGLWRMGLVRRLCGVKAGRLIVIGIIAEAGQSRR